VIPALTPIAGPWSEVEGAPAPDAAAPAPSTGPPTQAGCPTAHIADWATHRTPVISPEFPTCGTSSGRNPLRSRGRTDDVRPLAERERHVLRTRSRRELSRRHPAGRPAPDDSARPAYRLPVARLAAGGHPGRRTRRRHRTRAARRATGERRHTGPSRRRAGKIGHARMAGPTTSAPSPNVSGMSRPHDVVEDGARRLPTTPDGSAPRRTTRRWRTLRSHDTSLEPNVSGKSCDRKPPPSPARPRTTPPRTARPPAPAPRPRPHPETQNGAGPEGPTPFRKSGVSSGRSACPSGRSCGP
jgi:hypothetical protein